MATGRSTADPVEVSFAASGPSGPDITPPSTPEGLSVSYDKKKGKNKRRWKNSTDAVGVTGYEILRDGVVLVRAKAKNKYDDAKVTSGRRYSYTVRALDAAGNVSADSNTVAVTTP